MRSTAALGLFLLACLPIAPEGPAEDWATRTQEVRAALLGATSAPQDWQLNLRALRQALVTEQQLLESAEARLASGESVADDGALQAQREAILQLEQEIPSAFRAELAQPMSILQRDLGDLTGRMTLASVRRAEADVRTLLSNPVSERVATYTMDSQGHGRTAPKQGRTAGTVPGKVSYRAAGQPPFIDAPAPGASDLAEDTVIRLTPEIRQKAADLGRNPARIYAFVRNQIEHERYFGMLQNSQSVLWAGRGNDYDQATLLIALLRASGIQSRHVGAFVRMPMQEFMHWAGVKTPAAALRIGPEFTYVEPHGNEVWLDHVLVEAYVATPSGMRWVWMAPSIKTYNYQPGLIIPKPAFDRDAYLRTVHSDLSTDLYRDTLRQTLTQTNPSKSLSDLPYAGPIVPVPEELPDRLPFQLIEVFGRSTLDAGYRHRIEVRVFNGNTQMLAAQLELPQMLEKSITVSFASIPGSGVNQAPQLRLDQQVVATGTFAAAVGTALDLRVDYYYPFDTEPTNRIFYFIRVGDQGALIVNGSHLSERSLAERVNRLLSGDIALTGSNTTEAQREMLHIAGSRYFHRWEKERKQIGALFQYAYVPWRPEFGFTRSFSTPETLFDRPFIVTPRSLGLDATGSNDLFLDQNSDSNTTPDFRNFRRMIGLTGAAMEHELWEEIALKPGMSAVKALGLAGEAGQQFLTFNQNNAGPNLARLNFPPNALFNLQGFLTFGSQILAHERQFDYEGARWAGFLAEELPSGSTAHQIFLNYDPASIPIGGGASGINTGEEVEEEPGGHGSCQLEGCAICPDPVTLSNGNMWHQFDDASFPDRALPLLLKRTYNSQSTRAGAFGYGWTHSYEMQLSVSGNSATLRHDTGGTYTFSRQGTAFVSPLALGLTLQPDGADFVLRNRRGSTWRFNAAGKLVRHADRYGTAMTFSYDGTGNLTSIQFRGRTLALSYGTGNRISSVQDSLNRSWNYAYNAAGDLTESRDPQGNRTLYTYYSGVLNNHNLRTVTDPEGRVLTFLYYANDKVFKTITAEGAERRYFYMPFRNETQVVDLKGYVTRYQYDNAGRVVRVVDPNGGVATQSWDASGLLATASDAAGFETRFEYNSAGNLTKITDPLGRSVEYSYTSAFQQIASTRDAAGNTVRYEYDANGNRTKLTDPLGNETRFTYDAAGNLLSATDAEGNVFRRQYDEAANVNEYRDATGNRTQLNHDGAGRMVSRTSPSGQRASLSYDDLNRPTGSRDEIGGETKPSYDRVGNMTQHSDENLTLRRFTYDGLNNLRQVTDAAGGVTVYGYTTSGCFCVSAGTTITSARNPKGSIWTYEHDFRDQLVQVNDPLGNSTSFEYDVRGNPSVVREANGSVVRYEYDAANQLTARVYADGSRDSYSYDSRGNMTRASNAAVTYTMTYEERGLLATFRDSRLSGPMTYSYDRAGRIRTRTVPGGGTTTYAFNANGLLASVANPNSLTISFAYDDRGRRSALVYPNSTRADYTRDAAGRVLSITFTGPGGAVQQRIAYTYDAVGNISARTDAGGEHRFQYDLLYRLTSSSDPGQAAQTYVYDSVGNRTATGSQTGFTYDTANRLLRAGTTAYGYDASGLVISRREAGAAPGPSGQNRTGISAAYSYSPLLQMTRVEGSGLRAAYKYDPLGRRIEKNVDGSITQYLWDGANIAAEYNGAGTIVARYAFGPGVDEPLLMERDLNGNNQFNATERFYYQADVLGSIVTLTDSTGQIEERYRYDSFGKPAAASALGNPFLFTGREWDRESGLYYYRARFYDPSIGRFLRPDPRWSPTSTQSLNHYVYVSNNPVNAVDPSGLAELNSRQEQYFTTVAGEVYNNLERPVTPQADTLGSKSGIVQQTGPLQYLTDTFITPPKSNFPTQGQVQQDMLQFLNSGGAVPPGAVNLSAAQMVAAQLKDRRDFLLAKRDMLREHGDDITQAELTELVDIVILRRQLGCD